MSGNEIDAQVAAGARRQHGVFNRGQVLALGLTDRQIEGRVANGRWLRLARGVYALPGNPPTWERQAMAAVLAEPAAVLSGRAAATLHGFAGYRRSRIEITVPRGANHRSRFATVHQSDLVRATVVDGIPVTTVEQTVIDLAGHRSKPPDIGALIDELVTDRRTSHARLSARLQQMRRHNRAGLVSVERALAQRAADAWVPPASTLERALHGVLGDPRVPDWRAQAPFPWRVGDARRLDALIARWRLIVEADGRTWHTRVADFAVDRRRDHEALVHGHLVLRFGWEELVEDPDDARTTLLLVGAQRELFLGLSCGREAVVPGFRGLLPPVVGGLVT